jgi:hypothetical protein
MVAQSIEQLKNDWTDKYVIVDGQRPELARFRDLVGQVKTVNMSGRALVEFLDYHLNNGWYDIDLGFLKIVDKPAPKAAKPDGKKAPAKPAAKGAPAGQAAAEKPKPAGKPAAGKPSVADILAAARAGKAPAKPAAAAESASAGAPGAPMAAAPAKIDRSKMSVADMLAAARAGGADGGAKTPPAARKEAESAPDPEPEPEAAVADEPVVESAAPAPSRVTTATSSEKIDKSKMSTDDMINWCRAHDTK